MKQLELAYWINERYSMKLRKEAMNTVGKFGWSEDPHMGLVRYCNVHREDDKVTKWLAQHWRPQFQTIWATVLARMVNYIPSLEEMLPAMPHIADSFRVLAVRRDGGDKIWTSAYTISTCGKSMDKIDYVMNVVGLCKDVNWNSFSTLAVAHSDIMCTDGLGSFLAAQVVADLKNIPGHPLHDAQDRHTWCAHGPGSLKGLSEFWGLSVTPKTFIPRIKRCYELTMPLVDSKVPIIDMQDFQNCLCEFSKYVRVSRGGHARNNYRPG